jgi:hypothetical protein
MKTWTPSRDWSGKYLPIVNSWKPQYGGFDYRVSKTDTQAVEVVAECEAAVRWLPSIRSGVESYCEEMRAEGEVFQDIKISLTKIYDHEMDTSEGVMYFRGRMFLHVMEKRFSANRNLTSSK